MKLLFTCVITLFSFSTLFAQPAMNAAAKYFDQSYEQFLAQSRDDQALSTLIEEFDLVKIEGSYAIGVSTIVDTNQIDEEYLASIDVKNDTRLENLWTFRVPIHRYEEFLNATGLQYVEMAEPVSPNLELSRTSARVDSVHEGLGDIAQAYTGKNVVIAVIDWGFDYTHPQFYDTTLNNYRIVRAWDQNKMVGTPPDGYSFGAEYKGKEELLQAQSDTNYVFGYSSHGSHVAGIAGGGGGGTPFTGAAPEADLIFISLRRDAPSLLDAFSYITNYAASVNKPYVVNMSFGSHLGPHDGTSMKNLGIDLLHGPGKVFVGSAGNNGRTSANFHLDNNFSENPDDTLVTVVNFNEQPEQFGQTLSMWGSQDSDFSVSVVLADGMNETVFETSFYNTLDEPNFIDTHLVADDTLIIRMMTTASFFLNQKPNIRLELKNTTDNKVVLKATSKNTHLHIWNNVRMNNRYTNWGVPLTDNYPNAVAGDNHYGLGEPAGVGKNVITVASYRAKLFRPSGIIDHGHLSSFSSWGPTVDERIKPDIASTGESVASSVNSFDISQTSFTETVEFEGREYGWARFSGTSMSGPMVAGIVGLMLEANPSLSATKVKEILRKTARLDEYTDEDGVDENGHLRWGWGKANALAAVKAVEVYLSTVDAFWQESLFSVYPNPAKGRITVASDDHEIKSITLTQVDGKSSKTVRPASAFGEVDIDVNELPSGMYIIKVETGDKFAIQKLIIQ